MLRRDALRRDGVTLTLRLVAQTTHPLIVAGDFNLPPRGPLSHSPEGQLTNAFAARGLAALGPHRPRVASGR